MSTFLPHHLALTRPRRRVLPPTNTFIIIHTRVHAYASPYYGMVINQCDGEDLPNSIILFTITLSCLESMIPPLALRCTTRGKSLIFRKKTKKGEIGGLGYMEVAFTKSKTIYSVTKHHLRTHPTHRRASSAILRLCSLTVAGF